jgi:ribonuclease VapC
VSLFLDASAIVAIIAREPEAGSLLDRLEWEPEPRTSAIAVWEASRGMMNVRGVDLDEARGLVADFLQTYAIGNVGIGGAEGKAALDAHDRYGKGNHPARLNMGDCFAYACAKTNGAELLYKGDDFALTDLA